MFSKLRHKSDIECTVCKTKFKQRKNLYSHIRTVHKFEPLLSKIREQECKECKNKFTSKTMLDTHMRSMHKIGPKTIDSNNEHNYAERALKHPRLTCPSEGCSEQFSRYSTLSEHVEDKHDSKMEIEVHIFSSFLAFETWKTKMEKETMSSYVQDTGIKKLSGIQKKYYSCSRSYHYDPPSDRKRKMKSMGSNKINKACPSRLVVSISDANGNLQLRAKLWKTHYGHTDQIERTKLDKVTRAAIAAKLKEGFSFEHILNMIRNSEHSDRRLLLLKRKDMHNIVRDFNINYSAKRHENDDITKSCDVDNLGFNDFNLKVNRLLDVDDERGNSKPDYLSTTLNKRVSENENASLVCGINVPVTDRREINVKVPKRKNAVGDDDGHAVMDMEAVAPVNPEHFGYDGDGKQSQEHQRFCCNVCLGKIVGFRYRCCECEDYDMCSDCESRGIHPLHYVIRVPEYRKQCEVRRVVAAVHVALSLPADVKDELTIKIEDPEEEPPPDPLHTDEADPTDEADNTPPLTAADLTPSPAKISRIELSKRNEEVKLKLVRTDKAAIPVALDALKRKAIVRLNRLKLHLQENSAQIESDKDIRRKHSTKTTVTKKETIEKALQYTRDFSQSTPQSIDHYTPTMTPSRQQQQKHFSSQPFQSKRKLKAIDHLTSQKGQEVTILPKIVTRYSEDIFVVEQTDDAIVEENAEEVFHMTEEDFNALKSLPSQEVK